MAYMECLGYNIRHAHFEVIVDQFVIEASPLERPISAAGV